MTGRTAAIGGTVLAGVALLVLTIKHLGAMAQGVPLGEAPAYRVTLPTGQNVPARNPRLLQPLQYTASGERLYEIEALIGNESGQKWIKIRIGDTQVTHGVLPGVKRA